LDYISHSFHPVTEVPRGESDRVALRTDISFWSRVVFIVVYYAGVPYLRTLIWTTGSVGLAIMVSALF
jgi:uncharacterized MAPEG superfamily protein